MLKVSGRSVCFREEWSPPHDRQAHPTPPPPPAIFGVIRSRELMLMHPHVSTRPTDSAWAMLQSNAPYNLLQSCLRWRLAVDDLVAQCGVRHTPSAVSPTGTPIRFIFHATLPFGLLDYDA